MNSKQMSEALAKDWLKRSHNLPWWRPVWYKATYTYHTHNEDQIVLWFPMWIKLNWLTRVSTWFVGQHASIFISWNVFWSLASPSDRFCFYLMAVAMCYLYAPNL